MEQKTERYIYNNKTVRKCHNGNKQKNKRNETHADVL